MPVSPTASVRPRFGPFGLVLLSVFALALLASAVSTQGIVKRLDAPPAGVFLVIAGQENTLFVRLAQKSIKGLHRAEGLRAQLTVPGEAAPRPLSAHSQNSTTWETKIKTPQLTPGAKPADIESHVALLLSVAIPDDPKLYGLTLPTTFDLDMLVPRLDAITPKVGRIVPESVSWTMQLQIQPPGYRRIFQKVNRLGLITAGAAVGVALLGLLFRRRQAAD